MATLDSDLKTRYEEFLKRRADMQKSGQISTSEKSDLERTLDSIKRDWREIVYKRRQGVMTDTTNTDAVRASMAQLARLHQIPVSTYLLGNEDYGSESDEPVRKWRVEMRYSGLPKFFDKDKWHKLIEAVHAELRTYPFVLSSKWQTDRWMTQAEFDAYIHEDEDFDFDDEDFEDEEDDQEDKAVDELKPENHPSRESAIWIVDTWIWDGP